MILQQLYADADPILKQTGRGALPPSMYSPKRVRWIVELSASEGVPVQFSPLRGEGKQGERGIERLVPDMKRSSGVRPLLLADKTSYAVGVRIPDPKKDAGRDEARDRERTRQEFEAFRALTRECAEATGSADVAVVARFLEAWDPEKPPVPLPPDVTRDDLFTFRVDGRLPIEDPAVQRFWAARGRDAGEDSGSGEDMQCLVSGVVGPVEEMMPVSVKGIPGGQASGMQIVSANAAAFESYGLRRARTSPISRDAGERFGKALNALLASEYHRSQLGAVTYVFWARSGIVKLFAFQPDPDAKTVRELLSRLHTGEWRKDLPDEARFHIFGLSANAARVVVRSAIDTTIGYVAARQEEWFRRLDILGFDGADGKPLPLRTLAVSPYREFKDIAPGVEDALVRAALTGDPLPPSLLTAVVMRCRLDAENRVTYPRAALMKYIVTQHLPLEKASTMTTEIATSDALPFEKRAERLAYHCGRLFAELEDIQRTALPGINATINDRFFGAASSAPASVFGILLDGVQDHLGKLRRERGAVHAAASRRLEEIMAEIDDFPRTLTLRDQALFSLGYYHHKAAKRRDIAERAAAKRQAGNITPDSTDSTAAAENEK